MVDVVIVGAGAAGIGAGRQLAAQGISFVILEASGRIGGRAFTDRTSLPGQWEQGCQWFHSARDNPLVPVARSLGWAFETADRTGLGKTFVNGGWLTPAEEEARSASMSAAFDAVYGTAAAGRDGAISAVIPEAGRWSPFVRNLFQQMISEDPEKTSALGYGDYDDQSGENWIVTGGLGALIETLAAGLPVRTGVAVTAIEKGPGGVRVETTEGSLDARAAIVTASTNLLLSGAIRFGSPRVKALLERMQDLPCGSYEKIVFAFDRLPSDAAELLFYGIHPDPQSLPLTFQILSGPHPKLIAHVGGSAARELAALGPDAMIGYAREHLAAAFGHSVAQSITGTATTAWQANPWVRGAYSYARVGCGRSRRAMIAMETGAIRFAGEAFSLNWHATAHGAWQSGQDVAGGLAREFLG